jgi:O-methyltransferase
VSAGVVRTRSLASRRFSNRLASADLDSTEIMDSTDSTDTTADLYLSLLKGCLTRSLFPEEQLREVRLSGWRARAWAAYGRYKKHPDWRIVKPIPARDELRAGEGRVGETMIGDKRLENIQQCVASVIEDDIPGDLIEAGVWRGGAAILMRAVLAAYGVSDRCVWVADSFQGLPPPNPDEYPGDEGLDLSGNPELAVSVEQVKANFARYGLLDEQVQFLVGWFKDTLPVAPIEQLAVLRIDGDLYESTMDALVALYPKLSVGGYLIVDDYGAPMFSKACRQAIIDYRAMHDIVEPIHEVDWTGAYWRRER